MKVFRDRGGTISRVIFVHDWLVNYRGGERVLEALLPEFPDAPIYTLFVDRARLPESIASREIRTPWLWNELKPIRKALLPLLPRAVESIKLPSCDLVISTSSCVAKGIKPPPGAKHLCYLHSPMRYMWDQQQEYLQAYRKVPFAPSVIRWMTPGMRAWDVKSCSRVDQFIVNSTFVGDRVSRYYGREARVVFPPVEVGQFYRSDRVRDYFLVAGSFEHYKRFDLAISACESVGVPLIVAGSGPMESELRRQAKSYTTFFVSPSDREWAQLMAEARAFLFPGVEDFGITAIEAMASGTPVIARRAGGALDFVHEGRTGLFFDRPTSQDLARALKSFQDHEFDPENLVRYAANYRREIFVAKMIEEVKSLMGES